MSSESAAEERPSPQPYKAICVSIYNEDLRHLDRMVAALHARGIARANRSALIRYALALVDIEAIDDSDELYPNPATRPRRSR